MVNPPDDPFIARLCQAIEDSRRALEPFRTNRLKMLKSYHGSMYGEVSRDSKTPLPLLAQAVEIYTNQLVAREPGVMVSTNYRSLKPTAAVFELAINQTIRRINLQKPLADWVLEALFGLGVLKLGTPVASDLAGHEPGDLVAEAVAFDDFVYDTTATSLRKASFYADRFQIARERLMTDGSYDRDAVAKLNRADKIATDTDGEAKSLSLSIDDEGSSRGRSIQELVELYDVFLPWTGEMITLDVKARIVLRRTPWGGPKGGPYHFLQFASVPGNAMPLSPMALLFDLHDIVNRLYRKAVRQAERQKNLSYFQGGSEKDANRVKAASDGDLVRIDRQQMLGEMRFGGADQPTLAMALQTKQLFNLMGGNLEALGGLGPQAETLGQDELLAQTASQKINRMRDTVLHATSGVIRDIGQYLWNDRLYEPVLVQTIPGTDLEAPVQFTTEDRVGDFIEYNFRLDPTSMGPQGPLARHQSLQAWLNGYLLPLAPLAQQQGIEPDVEPILREGAQSLGRGDVDALLRFTQGAQNPAPGPSTPPRPASTVRTNVRVNRPGTTAQSQERSMIGDLMNNAATPTEATT